MSVSLIGPSICSIYPRIDTYMLHFPSPQLFVFFCLFTSFFSLFPSFVCKNIRFRLSPKWTMRVESSSATVYSILMPNGVFKVSKFHYPIFCFSLPTKNSDFTRKCRNWFCDLIFCKKFTVNTLRGKKKVCFGNNYLFLHNCGWCFIFCTEMQMIWLFESTFS